MRAKDKPRAVLILGPTASGKSALAMSMAAQFPAEIISVDSAQVFRDMDIGTAKPTPEEQAAVPHHLIDILNPEQSYSAARFRENALLLMADITARGKTPILAGGTMLYFKALLEGLSPLPPADPALRADIEIDAANRGWPALHADLAKIDPQSAARLAPNDAQRIQRALEINHLTRQPVHLAQAAPREAAPDYAFETHALMPDDRAELHRCIAARFDAMLDAGFVEEVIQLRRRHTLHADLPAMRCVGYRQVWDMLEGQYGQAEMRDRGIFATRQLAKRQLTWLRGMALPGRDQS